MEINGVDAGALMAGREQVRKDPSQAQSVFRATTVWDGGARSTSRVRNFTLEADESAALFGTDRVPSPVEQVLAALGACLTVGISYMAALEGIRIDAIEIETEGNLDVRGFFGLKGAPPGYQQVRVTVHLRCDAGRRGMQALLDRVVATSPVTDIIARGVPVSVQLGG
ncbi:OsmC family protein [Methanoculleus sp. FWC-SCC1]|uniref:OsmC family protein n=1 Tax=Methanoculleus frigidifontis TaxID=2584085 RepID=A0ABT8MC46_9EURY|nr:OsmC family protein [Methanoculleus sp. FWC-SCC1]MDN7025518.1 OsmC family protein [Methanoculleus sp. FWC-SCC1]